MNAQDAKDHAILMSYDAMRICMGIKPVNATASEVIRWMETITALAARAHGGENRG